MVCFITPRMELKLNTLLLNNFLFIHEILIAKLSFTRMRMLLLNMEITILISFFSLSGLFQLSFLIITLRLEKLHYVIYVGDRGAGALGILHTHNVN